MSEEMIKTLIGKECTFSTGPLGETFKKVKVVEVVDKWIRVQDGRFERLINSDYLSSVKVLNKS